MMNKIIYRIRNLSFILYLVAFIILMPNIKKIEVIGNLLLVSCVFYTLLMYYFYLKKDEKLNNNIIQNLLTIFLYLYIFFVAIKYKQFNNYELNITYFKINYILIIISTLGIGLNNFLLSEKK